MRIGVPREIKDKENRIALTPAGASALSGAGHEVAVEQGAGAGSGFSDDDFRAAGATVVSVDEAWAADLVIKVKEPMPQEYPRLRDNILFTYLHLAGVRPDLTDALLSAGTAGIAYETVEDEQGRLPLLAPMSAIAGNMAALVGSYYLAKFNGGRGVQLGSVLGDQHGDVMVIGAGVVGQHAAMTAAAMGARVTIYGRVRAKFDGNPRLAELGVQYVESTPETIADAITGMDLVVGAVLLAGAKAPHVVSEAMVASMAPGAVVVDVSIDQGGCIATARPTSHSDPVYVEHGVIHYCVTNMPGAYPRTATEALTSRTLPYVHKLADAGLDALRSDPGLARGLNTWQGGVTYAPVAEALGLALRAFH
jgi:alanine dehydrogenase